jgi:hypothetical protein
VEGLSIMVALAAAMLVLLYRLTAGERSAAVERGWQQAAHELGGTYSRAAGAESTRTIRCQIGGVDVTLDHYTTNVGHDDTTYTRVRAAAALAPEHRLRVFRAEAWDRLARAVGVEDVPTGDAEFDDDFIVQASDSELAALWLNRAVRKRIRAAPEYMFTLRKARITGSRDALEDDPAALVAAANAVAALADGRQRVLRAWKRVARAHGGDVQPVAQRWARLRAEVDGVAVEVDTRFVGAPSSQRAGEAPSGHITVVEAARHTRNLPAFAMAREAHLYGSAMPLAEVEGIPDGYLLWTEAPRQVLDGLDGETRFMLDDVGPAKVRVDDDRVRLSLRGVVVDRRELEGALTLAARLAGGRHPTTMADGV